MGQGEAEQGDGSPDADGPLCANESASRSSGAEGGAGPSNERLVAMARLRRPHGIKGHMIAVSYAEPPEALWDFAGLLRLAPPLGADAGRGAGTAAAPPFARTRPAALTRLRALPDLPGGFLVSVEGAASREAASALANALLYVPRSALPPLESGAYWADLEGLAAVDEKGEVLGRVAAVADFGAGPLLEIAPPSGPSWYVRFAPPELVKADPAAGRVVLRPRAMV